MRLATAAAFAALAATSGCGSDTCSLPAHCLAAARVQGACQCTEWEIVAVEEVAVPHVVVTVIYPMAGNASGVYFGGEWTDPEGVAHRLSPAGIRLRAAVREAGGAETAARVLPTEGSVMPWQLDRVTDTTLAFRFLAGTGLSHRSLVDVPDHALDDRILVWVNARASVATDHAGGRSIRWSSGEALPECGPGSARTLWLTPAHLLGTLPPVGACQQAFLASLDAQQRAALLAHDAFYAPAGRDPQSFFSDPRFHTIRNTDVGFGHSFYGTVPWRCPAAPAEGAPALARSEVPMKSGRTLVVEHVAYTAEPSCAEHTFGITGGTKTEGCDIYFALTMDSMFGTVLTMAGTQWDWSGSPACTR